jgi:hypothetical protein
MKTNQLNKLIEHFQSSGELSVPFPVLHFVCTGLSKLNSFGVVLVHSSKTKTIDQNN